MGSEWSKELYEASVSIRCWSSTPYDDWGQAEVRTDQELQAIVAMEQGLGGVPEWAVRIVENSIGGIAPCGHYQFPRGYIETLDDIGTKKARAFFHTCFTVDAMRKQLLADLCLCLDAWLNGASHRVAAVELTAHGTADVDWLNVSKSVWSVLGEHSELKDLLVERTLLQSRWWIKSTVWDDDRASKFGRDQYLGDIEVNGGLAMLNGNREFAAPGFDLTSMPRVKAISARLRELECDFQWFENVIGQWSWLCAPKAFRYMENLLWSIGKERPSVSLPSFPMDDPDIVPDFLQIEKTVVDSEAAQIWWADFLSALDSWWQGQTPASDTATDAFRRLGVPDETKRWLVRLYAHRLRRLAEYGAGVGKLISAGQKGWGSGALELGTGAGTTAEL